MFAVLIPDNMSPIIARADPINPTFTVGWLDYVQGRGFATDAESLSDFTDNISEQLGYLFEAQATTRRTASSPTPRPRAAGATTVVVDRLGYGESDKPMGGAICFGSHADMAHQMAQRTRSRWLPSSCEP